MFTGIIKNLGKATQITGTQLVIAADPGFTDKLENGASVAVNGICLTVVDWDGGHFTVEVMPETVNRTNLKYLVSGDTVNLEMPATPETFLAGHIVQGHIDGTARLESITDQGNSRILNFSVPAALAKYIVEKGSIAVNGVSLTVIEAGDSQFTAGIIPHTWDATMFNKFKIGDFANIEADVLAKYLEKIMKNK